MTAPRSYYDVVVVGATLAGLSVAALLARRGFRVAVVGHGVRPQTYEHEGLTLRREPAAVTFTDTPAFRRVFAELALVPAVRRRLFHAEPSWQVALPRHRLDVSPTPERLRQELQREFPEVLRPVESFYAVVERTSALLDRVFGADVPWPPEGFFERREAARAAADLPFGRDGASGDVFAEFPPEHPFRMFVDAQARFAGALDPDGLTALRRVRLHGAALRAPARVEGGVDGLRALLADKVQQHGGDVRLRDRVESLSVKRGRVTGVVLSSLDEALGSAFVVSALDAAETQRWTGEPASRGYAQRLLGVRPRYHRYVLNVVLPEAALPVGMASRVYFHHDATRPPAEENLLAVETAPCDPQGLSGLCTLTVSALLPRSAVMEGEVYMHRVRERVLRSLGALVPFLERHVRVVDSPHDGLPLEDRTKGVSVTLEARWSGAPEPMGVLDAVDAPGFLGVCALPCRGDLKGLLLTGRQVVPGLGVEGELMAALTVAGIITRTDRSKERMRRELWSKVEHWG